MFGILIWDMYDEVKINFKLIKIYEVKINFWFCENRFVVVIFLKWFIEIKVELVFKFFFGCFLYFVYEVRFLNIL